MRWLSAMIGALLALTLGITLLQHTITRHPHSQTPSLLHRLAPHHGLSSLPLAAQGAVSATLGAKNPTYRVTASGDGFHAQSSAQRLRMRFEGTGIQIGSGKMQVGLSLRAMGYGTSLRAIGDAKPSANANRVTYRRAGLSEWYVNGPLGLEQGFTISKAPSGNPAAALTLSMALSGNTHASLASDGQSITFSRSGSPSLRYDGLTATDAGGRALHSWLELHAGRLLLRVDTRGARYPLRIDPFVQQGPKLTATGEAPEGVLGDSVALSADGDTALVGAPGNSNKIPGEVFIFQRSEGVWHQQGAGLTPEDADPSNESQFGESIALSANGDTALVGGRLDNGETGAAWVFTREESTWKQQGPKLTASGEQGAANFGSGVALSADGNTALIGGPNDDANTGAAWVFVRSGSTWTQQGPKLTASRSETYGLDGKVALSADGDTALLGAGGTALVFTRSGESWAQQGPAFEANEVSGEYFSGWSVALSANGNTALVGSIGDNALAGAAWVFIRSGNSWAQQGPKLVPNDESGDEGFGQSVSLSGEGNVAILGGAGYDGSTGAAWVFRQSGTSWSQRGSKLTDTELEEPEEDSEFGVSVALSADSDTAIVGAINADEASGAAFVFVNPTEAPPAVISVSPSAGLQAGGTSVTITGTNLSEATAVEFGSTNATSFKVESATEITATSPAGTGMVDVTVTTPGGTSATGSADHFTYVPSGPAPTVKKISPAKGAAAGGTSVTITGTGFTGTTAVDFGSTSATSFTVNSVTSITATSPAETTGTVDVTVTTPNGTSAVSTKDHFAFEAPTITRVSPNSGSKAGGTTVTITGTGFGLGSTATTFKFSKGIAIEVDCTSTTTCTMLSPAAAKDETADVTATVDKKTSAKDPPADEFAYH